MHRQNLKLLLPKVYEEMRLQENTLFDLNLGVKVSNFIWRHEVLPGHMTKMAAMPIYGKNPLKYFFSRTRRPMTLGLGM